MFCSRARPLCRYLAENETEDLAERFSEVHAALQVREKCRCWFFFSSFPLFLSFIHNNPSLTKHQEVGFEDTERQAIYSMLAAILHLGNIEFEAAVRGGALTCRPARTYTHHFTLNLDRRHRVHVQRQPQHCRRCRSAAAPRRKRLFRRSALQRQRYTRRDYRAETPRRHSKRSDEQMC